MKEMVHSVKVWTRDGSFGRILDGQTASETAAVATSSARCLQRRSEMHFG